MKSWTEEEALNRAASFCVSAERSVKDVRQKIEGWGLESDVVERILRRLVDERFVDEVRFCNAFVKDKLRFNKWGKQKISLELYKKGIDSSLRSAALSEIDDEEYERVLLSVLETKRRSIKEKDERTLKMKLFRFALGRGFESGVVSSCLKMADLSEDGDAFFE